MAEVIHTYLPMIRLPDRAEELAGMYRAVLTGQRVISDNYFGSPALLLHTT